MKAARFSPRHRAKTRSIRSDIAGILSADFSPRETMTLSALANGYILGWSVAWPPGPINAEMIRRGLLPKDRGGGFWSAWPIGLGACTGDFIWAFGVSVGAGALLNSVEIRRVLAIVSLVLLLFLAVRFCHWGVENLLRPSQRPVSSTKKRTARRFLVWSFCGVDESVERWLLAGRDRQSARAKRECATVPRHRGRGCPRCANLGRGLVH